MVRVNEARTALVTGASRGIGLDVVRQLAERGLRVVLGARDSERGAAAAAPLEARGLSVMARQLDPTEQASVDRLAAELRDELGRLDVLVNNAAAYPSGRARDMDLVAVEDTLRLNTVAPWRMAEAVIPLMFAGGYGRIVNVSSEAGSLTSMGAWVPAYNVSKAALNGVTRVLAADLAGTGILVNSVCPGWVRTDMGGPSAPRSVEQGAASVVWGAMLPEDGPTGGFFRDGQPLPW